MGCRATLAEAAAGGQPARESGLHAARSCNRGASRREQIRFGVLGDPVAHSLSPQMQNAALEQIGSRWRYARFQIAPNELAEALHLMAALGFLGVNLTVPHKGAGLALVDDADDLARTVGAINTIVFRDGRRVGANTDGPGFERAIVESFGVALREQRVLLLGAGGGAGRAIAAQCARAGCRSLTLVNRDPAKAEALARHLRGSEIVAFPGRDDSLGAALARSDLVVQATSLGLQPDDPSPLPRGCSSRDILFTILSRIRPPFWPMPVARARRRRTASPCCCTRARWLLNFGWNARRRSLRCGRHCSSWLFPNFSCIVTRSFSAND